NLIILSPEKMTIERWDLTTFKQEQVVPVPFPERVVEIAMGPASPGPLVILVSEGTNKQSCKFIDPHTLKLLELQQFIEPERAAEEADPRRSRFLSRRREEQTIPEYLKSIHPSASGQLVTTDYCMMMITENSVVYRLNRNSGLPDAAGNLLYSPKSVYSVGLDESTPSGEWGIPYPSVQPGLYFVVHSRNVNSNAPQSGIVLQIENDPGLQFPLEKVNTELSINSNPFNLPMEKRFTYIPAAELVVQIPSIADRLILHKADISAMLKKSKVDYAYVTSIPPNSAVLGENYQYQLTVVSNKGVKYELTAAPAQMTISSTGLIQWQVPDQLSDTVVPVEVQLEMASGKKTKYAFAIAIPAVSGSIARKSQMAAALKEQARQDQMQARRYQQFESMLKKLEESGPKAKQLVEERALGYLRQMEETEKRKQAEYELRSWKDAAGNELEAKFVEVFAGKVKLKSETSGDYDVPLIALSAQDQTFIQKITAAAREKRKQLQAEDPLPTSPRQQLRVIYTGMQQALQKLNGRFLTAHHHASGNRPLLSWRVDLLRYVGGEDLYRLFRHDEPWDSEYNKRLIPLMPAFYRTPNSKAGEGKTNLQVIIGDHCLFKSKGYVGLTEVTDELSQTAMLVEVPDKLAVEWTKPDDWEFTSESSIKDLFGFQPGGFYALFADGAVKLISSENSLKEISRAFIRDDGETLNLK
ncbi:MAG: hypothetical protein KDA74_05520, partial [Planctomycetaceae bacterium]|nr:hypothetical protein [Planctomycetaceae bacterium]